MKVVAFKCDNCCAVTEIPVNKAIKLILDTRGYVQCLCICCGKELTSNLVIEEGEIKDD
jgi:hypothetical protein|nr:MAG TPA: DNA-directed RNA polymerase [Caudoviricetes sp.]